MKESIRNYFQKNADFNWDIIGMNTYVQVRIEAGKEIGNWIISEICENNDCCSSVSCVHTKDFGYCLMIEFYK